MTSLSIVVPVYRAEGSLRELHRRLLSVLEARGSAFEILFVEDCGGDGSWAVIQEIAASDARVRGLRMSRNYGQHNALLCGIRAAAMEVVVTLDAILDAYNHDGSDPMTDYYDVRYYSHVSFDSRSIKAEVAA